MGRLQVRIERLGQQGDRRTQRANLLRAIQVQLKGEVPNDLVQVINAATDLATLAVWFDLVLTAPSLDALRAVIQPLPGQTGNGATASP